MQVPGAECCWQLHYSKHFCKYSSLQNSKDCFFTGADGCWQLILSPPYYWWKKSFTSWKVVYPCLSHYWPGFIHPKWCRISSINRIMFHIRSVLNSAKNLWDRHWQSWIQIPKKSYLMHSRRSHGTFIHFAEETDLKMKWQKEVSLGIAGRNTVWGCMR